jgi:hypothetical protein
MGDEAVLLDLESGLYFGLNGTGLRVWELVTAGYTAAETLARLAEEFDAPREKLTADVESLLGQLEREGLLSPAPDPGSEAPR